jgi:phage shock protein A
MPEEEQAAIKEWFKEKAEGEKAKTEGELIAQIRSLQENGLESENELKEARESLKSLEKELDTLSGNFSESKKELEEIRATATYEELQEREADLEKLREERAKLKNKIKEMKGTPDLNVLLIDCVSKQLQVNSVLKEVLANTASLNLAKLKEFEEAIKRTFEIIKSTKTKDQSGQRKKLND